MVKNYTLADFSVMSVQYCQYSYKYFLESMNQCGFSSIDLWGGAPHYSSLDYPNDASGVIRIKDLTHEHGCSIRVYTPETLSYPFSYSSPNPLTRQRTIEYMKRAIDDAKELGAEYVFLNSGCGLRDLPKEESWIYLISSLKEICLYAEEKNVPLLIEQLQPYESNLITSFADMKQIIHDVKSKILYICVDVVAMEVAKESLETWFDEFNNLIKLIHLSDSHHFILGDGHYNINSYLSVLKKNNYAGYITLEINDSIYWENPHDSMMKTSLYLVEKLGVKQ